jgi:hypothetical protein
MQKGNAMKTMIYYDISPHLEEQFLADPELGNVFRRHVQRLFDLNQVRILDYMMRSGFADPVAALFESRDQIKICEMTDFKLIHEKAFPNSDTLRKWESTRQSGTYLVQIFPKGGEDSFAFVTVMKGQKE